MANQVRILSTNETHVWMAASSVVYSVIEEADLSSTDMVLLINIYARLTGVQPDAGVIENYVSENR